MSDEIVFDVLCTKVLDALRALELGKFSIRNYYYEGMWPIIKVYRSEGVILYSAAFTNEIVDRFRLEHENGLVADRIWAKVRKAAVLFEEYVQTGKIVWKRVRPAPKIPLTPYYQELLCSFCQHEANTRAIGFESLRDEENVCRKFFAYLDASGYHTCQDINLVNVNDFLLFIASQRKSSMDRVRNTLKHLSAYLVSIQNCCDFSAVLTTRPAPRKKLRPAFSSKEVHTVMDAAAKNPSLSLRDTAMFAVAASLGLRAGDIVRLTLSDIDWIHHEIRFVQNKTGVELHLPLEASVCQCWIRGYHLLKYNRFSRMALKIQRMFSGNGESAFDGNSFFHKICRNLRFWQNLYASRSRQHLYSENSGKSCGVSDGTSVGNSF